MCNVSKREFSNYQVVSLKKIVPFLQSIVCTYSNMFCFTFLGGGDLSSSLMKLRDIDVWCEVMLLCLLFCSRVDFIHVGNGQTRLGT